MGKYYFRLRMETEMRKTIIILLLIILTVMPAFSRENRSGPVIGEAAIITLAFPWGARSSALGETFTGIADDEQALFFNPAGLGQSPLAKTWKHYSPSDERRFIALAGGTRNQRDVWALSAQNRIYRFNGVDWVDYSVHIVDTSETISMIVQNYTSFTDRGRLDAAVLEIKEFNNLYSRERRRVSAVLAQGMSQRQADSLAQFFAFMPFAERSRSNLKSYLMEFFDDAKVGEVVESVVAILDRISGLSGIFDLKIPHTIALSGKINDVACDALGRIWVAGDEGLWRFENSEWRRFASYDGIPNGLRFNSITVLSGGDVAIATSAGAYLFENGNFRKITGELSIAIDSVQISDTTITLTDTIFNTTYKDTIIDDIETRLELGVDTIFVFDTTITVSAAAKNLFEGEINYVNKLDNNIYIGTAHGLITVVNGIEVLVDSTRLVSNNVRVIAIDGRRRIWVGGDEGVSLFTGLEWQKFRFTNSRVYDIAIESNSRVWFATNNGAVEYVEARDGTPEWRVHHERNNLNSSVVNSAIFHRNDIWLATDNGISRLQSGQARASVFYQNLLPSLQIGDMFHTALAGVIPLGEWGSMGMFMSLLHFGDIDTWNPDGTQGETESAYELLAGIGYGMRLREDFSIGVNLKYYFSRLKKEEAEVHSFAVDAGLLKRNFLTNDLSLGLSFLNMGPSVRYTEDHIRDPIPFTIRLGTSYKPIRRSTHHLLLALDVSREIVYVDLETNTPAPFFRAIWEDFNRPEENNRDRLSKFTLHTGLEFNYLDFIMPRLGWMYDRAGHRNEINTGMGLKINVVSADFGIIFALGDNDVRQSQVRFSITYAR